ncbi:MAG: hypothetical protein EOP51_30700, partial [Sphingobacteriales bacterium]
MVIVNTTGGTPSIALTLNTSGVVKAEYVSGSGGTTLVFRYTVATGNADNNGIAIGSSIALNGGSITDAVGNNAMLNLNSVGDVTGVLIDANAAAISGVTGVNGTYRAGDEVLITVHFSKKVLVTGIPELGLNAGGYGVYQSGSNTNALVFRYLVVAGYKSNDLDYYVQGSLTGGNITDEAFIAAIRALPVPGTPGSLAANSNIIIDAVAPTSPTGLAATPAVAQNIISWNANVENDLASYKVYQGITANPTVLLATVVAGITTYTHTGLDNGTTYYYRISAVDNAGNESTVTADITSVPKVSQVITFAALTNATYGDSDIILGATAGSGLPVFYESDNTAIATIVAGKIHILKAGTVNIIARQAGNSIYAPATVQIRALTILKKDITVTANAKSKTYGDVDPELNYTFTPELVTGDVFTGSLSRAIGENVGDYAINQGSLVLSTNYT